MMAPNSTNNTPVDVLKLSMVTRLFTVTVQKAKSTPEQRKT